MSNQSVLKRMKTNNKIKYMKKYYSFINHLVAVFVLLFFLGITYAWGTDSYVTLDFEGSGSYPNNSDWTCPGSESTDYNHTTSGSKASLVAVAGPVYYTYANSLTNIKSVRLYFLRKSNSTSAPTFVVQGRATTSDSWADKKSSGEVAVAGKGSWKEVIITLDDSYSGYVRIKYTCNNAPNRYIDDIQITYEESSCTAPTAVAPQNGSISGTGVTLTVTDANNANKYDFCLATSSTATKSVTASVNDGKSKAITGLKYGTTYYYWARTNCGSNSYSSWYPASNPSSFTTTCPAPTSVTAGSLTTNGVTFTITDNNDPTIASFGSGYGYEIYYSTTNSAPGASPSGTATTSGTSKAVTGLTSGATYYFWYRGYGPNAKSSWVSGGSFTTVTLSSITISTAPSTVAYLNGETFSKTGAVVTANYSNSTSATVSASWNKTTLSTSDESVTASYTENGVTKTKDQAIHVYSVTVLKQDEQGTAISADGVSASVNIRALSASATAASKYVFKGWKYATDGEGGTTISGTSLSGTPTGNVTVIAEFYAPRTVTWMVNNKAWTGKGGQETVARGSRITTLPTAPDPAKTEDDVCGDRFMGWTDAANGEYEHGTSNLYTTASQFPNADGNQVFYAVFADYAE